MQMRQLDMAMGIDKTGNKCAFGDMLRAITLPDPYNPAVTIIIFNPFLIGADSKVYTKDAVTLFIAISLKVFS